MNIFARNNVVKRFIKYLIRRHLRNIGPHQLLRVFGPAQHDGNDRIEAAYVINLDRRPDRWEIFTQEACRQKVEGGQNLLDFCHRVSAVDGKFLKPGDAASLVVESYPLKSQYDIDPNPRFLAKMKQGIVNINMTPEEVAISLSHIKVWRQIVADKISYALILEDDVFFGRTFAAQLNRSWQELAEMRKNGSSFDIFYLSFREVDWGGEKICLSPNLNRLIRGYWCLSGYVLSCSAAEKLLQLLPVTGPVDLWMNHLFSKLEVYSTPDLIISQRADLPSDNHYSINPLLSK